MTKHKRPIRRPLYLKEFQCIGGACEDNCCIGWDVEIDQKTYKKYEKVKDEGLSQLFHQCIFENVDSYDSHVDYAIVELSKNNRCPFLNERQLCKIQAKLGEDYLSNVCATYPRYANEINGVVEYSATISCPEAARLILSKEEGLIFVEEEESVSLRNIINYVVNTKEHGGSILVQYFVELRQFTIALLQNRKYFLWQRILLLGYFYEELQDYVDKKKTSGVHKLIEAFQEKIDRNGWKEQLASTLANPTLQLKMLKEMTNSLNTLTEIDSERYKSLMEESAKGMEISQKSSNQEQDKIYQLAYEQYYEPFMKDKEYILENYLVNFVFEDLFPASESINPFEAYGMLVIRYTLLKFHLIGIGGFRKGLTEKVVAELIQVFSKAIEHHNTYLDSIAAYMKQKKYHSMAHMEILLKN